MKRGEIWWASLGEPTGSEPGFRRPVLIVSANFINASGLKTVLTVPITSNINQEHFAGNARLSPRHTSLSKPSVAQVGLVGTTNKRLLSSLVGRVPDGLMHEVDEGLRLVLAL